MYTANKKEIIADLKSIMKSIRYEEARVPLAEYFMVSLTHDDVDTIESAIRYLQEVV